MPNDLKALLIVLTILFSFLLGLIVICGYFNNNCIEKVKDKSATEIAVICRL